MYRMIPFKISKISARIERMLYRNTEGEWSGKLASELPGILAYALSIPSEYMDNFE